MNRSCDTCQHGLCPASFYNCEKCFAVGGFSGWERATEDTSPIEKYIDHEYTDEIVCPYCGHERGYSWEFDDDGECNCGNCGKTFRYNRHTIVTYSTEPIEEPVEEV